MDLIDGHTLPDLYPIDWVNNVDRDGLITWILISINRNGANIRNGGCISVMNFLEVNGQDWLKSYLEEQIMVLKITGIQ